MFFFPASRFLIHMFIFPPAGEHMGKVCGMCGNFNGDKEDDIRDANGDGKVNVRQSFDIRKYM